jgi:hypothetical protein
MVTVITLKARLPVGWVCHVVCCTEHISCSHKSCGFCR